MCVVCDTRSFKRECLLKRELKREGNACLLARVSAMAPFPLLYILGAPPAPAPAPASAAPSACCHKILRLDGLRVANFSPVAKFRQKIIRGRKEGRVGLCVLSVNRGRTAGKHSTHEWIDDYKRNERVTPSSPPSPPC